MKMTTNLTPKISGMCLYSQYQNQFSMSEYPAYPQPPLQYDVIDYAHTFCGVEYRITIGIPYHPTDENDEPYNWVVRETFVTRYVDGRGRFVAKGNVGLDFWNNMPRERVYDELCRGLESSLKRELSKSN